MSSYCSFEGVLDRATHGKQKHSSYYKTFDPGSDFDFDGYSLNVAADPQHATVVAAKREELEATVGTWY